VNESETSVAVTRRVVNQKKFVVSYSDCHFVSHNCIQPTCRVPCM